MLYHLFEWFKEEGIKFPGGTLLDFITFRVLLAMLLALVISLLIWQKIDQVFKKKTDR